MYLATKEAFQKMNDAYVLDRIERLQESGTLTSFDLTVQLMGTGLKDHPSVKRIIGKMKGGAK